MKLLAIPKKYLILTALLVIVVGGYFWRRSANQPTYQEYTVESRDMRETLDLSGEVSAAQVATLRFGAGGLVTYMGAKEGDQVKKWQTLASVDTRQVQKLLEQRLNLYAIQRGTFEQTIDDNDNSIPDGDLGRTLKRVLEKNQYQLDNAVKDVEYQNLALTLTRIYSPIQGILVSAPITVSNVQVSPTDTWVVVNPSTLEFVADLDETELTHVSAGQKVFITLDAYSDLTIESAVASISYVPKETSTGTTYELKMALPESEMGKLRLGLNGTAALLVQAKDSVPTLPSSAIKVENGASSIFVKEGTNYVSREIKTGIENDGIVEIVSGVGVGDHVYQTE